MKKGIPVVEVFQYLFLLILSNRSMYMSLITGRNTPGFAKDNVYRFMKMLQINWIRFTTLLASRVIRNAIVSWASACSHRDGQIAVPSCLSTAFCFRRKTKKNRINEAADVDKQAAGYRRRMLSMQKGTLAMLELLTAMFFSTAGFLPRVRSMR